jgi:hypothetical protein
MNVGDLREMIKDLNDDVPVVQVLWSHTDTKRPEPLYSPLHNMTIQDLFYSPPAEAYLDKVSMGVVVQKDKVKVLVIE